MAGPAHDDLDLLPLVYGHGVLPPRLTRVGRDPVPAEHLERHQMRVGRGENVEPDEPPAHESTDLDTAEGRVGVHAFGIERLAVDHPADPRGNAQGGLT